MRRAHTHPRSNLRDECAANRHHRRPPGRAALAAPLLAAVMLASIAGSPVGAQTTDPSGAPDVEVTRLRQQADAVAEEYFDALGTLGDLERRVGDLEQRIPALATRADELRAITRARAVSAYKRAGRTLSPVIGADDPVHAARRVELIDRVNAHDSAAAQDLRAAVDRLTTQRTELRNAKDAAVGALENVRARGREVDALLVAAEARRTAATAPSTASTTDPSAPAPPGSTAPTAAGAAPAPAANTATTTTTTTTTAGPAVPPPPSYSPTPGTHPRHDEPFLVCTRARESSGNYAAYNPAGPYMGAYQFLQTTWNGAANHAGRPQLIGVPPHTASPYDQDELGWALYQWQGARPWGGHCEGQ